MKHFKFNSGNVVLGTLIITAGILLLLFKAGIISLACRHVIFSWPMILIGIGFVGLFSWHKKWVGPLLMLIGGFFLLPKLNIDGFGFINDNRWAIIFIIIGIIVVFNGIFGHSHHHWWKYRYESHSGRYQQGDDQNSYVYSAEKEQKPGYIYREYVFGGSKETINTKNFKGGKISCVFGGIELDLSDAELADGINHLALRTVFGGIVIYMPADWHVEIHQHQVLGQFVDRRPTRGVEMSNDKILIIHTEMVLGGGELKCK